MPETNGSLKPVQKTRLSDVFRSIVTPDEAEILAKRAVAADAELVNYHLRSYSEEKIGFLGSHLCLILDVRKAGGHKCDKQSFFVKTVPYDKPSQAAYIEEKGCFRKESDFLKKVVPLMTKNYKGDLWAPTCYLTKEKTIVLEDMKSKGFINRPRMFDEKTARSAAACLARFHACSLLAEERLNGKSLIEVYPDLLEESEFKRTGLSYVWFRNGINLAVSVAEHLGLDSSNIIPASERLFDICTPSRTKRNVISHGDLWSSNMIFDDAGHCVLVDFQLIRYAPLAHDLMQMLYLATTREFRKKHERQIIEFYYATLKETLTANGYTGSVPSFEEVLQGAEEQRFPALVTAAIFHPTVLMDGKTAAVIMDSPATYESYYFHDRRPFVYDIMAKDPEYKIRIEEVVTELAEVSLIFDSIPQPT